MIHYNLSTPSKLLRHQQSTTLTYYKHHASMIGRRDPRHEEKSFLIRSLITVTIAIVACLYASANDRSDPLKEEDLVNQIDDPAEHNHNRRLTEGSHSGRTLLRYKSERVHETTRWNYDDFTVNGVNLAQFGLENEESPPSAILDEFFDLYEDLSIAKQIEAGEHSIHHLLMYHRHLERSSLAFYLDKIAQKEYLKAMGIPVASSFAAAYQSRLHYHESDFASILSLLPKHADYVIKTSHKKGKHIYVSYDPETKATLMGSEPNQIDKVYHPDLVADAMAEHLKKDDEHFLEPAATSDVPAGIIIEERFSASNSAMHPATKISVIVIWGRVFGARMDHAQGLGIKHGGFIFRNGTVVLDAGNRIKMPRWAQFPKIVEIAEELAAHKDFYQVDFEVGSVSSTSRLLEKATRQQQIEDIQVIVSDVSYSPSFLPLEEPLRDEIGRLWLAGYQMGIYNTIHNDESALYLAK